jgi:hypothetical protein
MRQVSVLPGFEMMFTIAALMASNSPELVMTYQSTEVAIQNMIPKAIENRNDVFITDHGSTRERRRRAFRVRRMLDDFAFGAVAATADAEAADTGAAGTAGVVAVARKLSGAESNAGAANGSKAGLTGLTGASGFSGAEIVAVGSSLTVGAAFAAGFEAGVLVVAGAFTMGSRSNGRTLEVGLG